jgi:hypothetical protein
VSLLLLLLLLLLEEKKGNDGGVDKKGETEHTEEEGVGQGKDIGVGIVVEERGIKLVTNKGAVQENLEVIGVGQKRKRKEVSEKEALQKKEKRRLQRKNRKIFLKQQELASSKEYAEANEKKEGPFNNSSYSEPCPQPFNSFQIEIESLSSSSSTYLSLFLDKDDEYIEGGDNDDNTMENIANMNENIVYMCAEEDNENVEIRKDDEENSNETVVFVAVDDNYADEEIL